MSGTPSDSETPETAAGQQRCQHCGQIHPIPAPPNVGRRETAIRLVSLFCMPCILSTWCCYITCCPPCPHECVRKLAFYPPAKSYTFEEIGRASSSRKKSRVVGKRYRVKLLPSPQQLLSPQRLTDYCEGFYVYDHSSHCHVACVKFSKHSWTQKGKHPRNQNEENSRNGEAQDDNYLLVFSHCNADDIGYILPELQKCSIELGCDIVAYDYRGFGQTKGSPRESACYSNIDAVLTHLKQNEGHSPDTIILMGRSLGACISLYAATRHEVAGVILDASITSGPDALGCSAFVPNCVAPFPAQYFIRKVTAPILALHGAEDELTSPEQLENMLRQAQYPAVPLFLSESGHNTNCEFTEYFQRIREFLANLPEPTKWDGKQVPLTASKRVPANWMTSPRIHILKKLHDGNNTYDSLQQITHAAEPDSVIHALGEM